MKLVNSEGVAEASNIPAISGPVIGELVGIAEGGEALVDFPGNTHGSLVAKTLVSMPPSQAVEGLAVLLQFEQNRADKPVIMGVVGDQLVSDEVKTVTLNSDLLDAALVDGKKIRIDAKDEIELVCGRSSILLRKDGKIVIKGMEVMSRAARTNKIRGSSVTIN